MSPRLIDFKRIRFLIISGFFLLTTCTDPVDPEFQLEYGLIYVDGFASTEPGYSYVTVLETGQEFGFDTNIFIDDAQVLFINVGTGEEVRLEPNQERYLPPADFKVQIGETWEMEVILSNGRRIVSEPERVRPNVPIDALEVRYDPEVAFETIFSRRVPGHELRIDFQDPSDEENSYLWQFRSYEPLTICATCVDLTILREGECINPFPNSPNSPLKRYYTYSCEGPCWQIRYNRNIEVFSDEFTDGTSIEALPVSQILLFTKEDILIELLQFSISREAYRYFVTLKDLTENNSGLNAPLPAALLGNLTNPEDQSEFVPGRFTAAAATVQRVFIERASIEEDALEELLISQPEGDEVPPPIVTSIPCKEGYFRTSQTPIGWPD